MKPALSIFLAVLFSVAAFAGTPSPSTRSPKFRLIRQMVCGLEPRQWVFLIVHPNAYIEVMAPSYLRRYIELNVPEAATLEWDPGCDRIGGEPMDSNEEMAAFMEFCQNRKLHFVLIPSG